MLKICNNYKNAFISAFLLQPLKVCIAYSSFITHYNNVSFYSPIIKRNNPYYFYSSLP